MVQEGHNAGINPEPVVKLDVFSGRSDVFSLDLTTGPESYSFGPELDLAVACGTMISVLND